MTQNCKERKLARELQQRTGWSYTRALYMVREKSPEEREAAVAARVLQLARPKCSDESIGEAEDARIFSILEGKTNP
jgi:hypothetical protein